MRNLIFLAWAVSFVACSSEPTKSAGIQVSPGRIIDLGTVAAGVTSVDISLRNDGDAPAKLLSATSSCSCALLDMPQDLVLEPGASQDARVNITISPGTKRLVYALFRFEGLAPVVVQVVLAGGGPAGIRHQQQHALGPLPLAKPHRVRLELEVGPDAKRLEDDSGTIPVVWTHSNRARVSFEYTGPTQLEIEDEYVKTWVDAIVTPVLPGEGQTRVFASLNGLRIPFELDWQGTTAVAIRPTVIQLAPESDSLTGMAELHLGAGVQVTGLECSRASVRVTRERTDVGDRLVVRCPRNALAGAAPVDLTVTVRKSDGSTSRQTVHCVPRYPTLDVEPGKSLDPDGVIALLIAQWDTESERSVSVDYQSQIAIDVKGRSRKYTLQTGIDGHPALGSLRIECQGEEAYVQVLHEGIDYKVERMDEGWFAVLRRRGVNDAIDRWGPVHSYVCPLSNLRWDRALRHYGVFEARAVDQTTLQVTLPFLPNTEDILSTEGDWISGRIGWRFTLRQGEDGHFRRTRCEELVTSNLAVGDAGDIRWERNGAVLADVEGGMLGGVLSYGIGSVLEWSEFVDLGGMTLPLRATRSSATLNSVAEIDPTTLRGLDENREPFRTAPPRTYGKRGRLIDELNRVTRFYGEDFETPNEAIERMVIGGARLSGPKEPVPWFPIGVALLLAAGLVAGMRAKKRRDSH